MRRRTQSPRKPLTPPEPLTDEADEVSEDISADESLYPNLSELRAQQDDVTEDDDEKEVDDEASTKSTTPPTTRKRSRSRQSPRGSSAARTHRLARPPLHQHESAAHSSPPRHHPHFAAEPKWYEVTYLEQPLWLWIAAAVALVLLLAFVYFHTSLIVSRHPIDRSNRLETFRQASARLRQKWPGLDGSTWPILNAAFAPLFEAGKAPAVLLIAGAEPKLLRCFAKDVAAAADEKASTWLKAPMDKAALDGGLRSGLRRGGIGVVESLETLSVEAAHLLHGFADPDEPAVEGVGLLFLLRLPATPEGNEAIAAAVEKRLRTAWASLPRDQFGPLFHRIAANIAHIPPNAANEACEQL